MFRQAESATSEATGRQLLQRIARKDKTAFRQFYELYAARIGSFLMRLLKNPEWVDEAVNDVMLVVWQSAADFDAERSRVSTWVFGIAHNKGLKLLERDRRRWREQSIEDEPALLPDDSDEHVGADSVELQSPERAALAGELGDVLLWAMERLTPEHQTVLELIFSEGCSYADVAEITGCPLNTVKTRLFHARKKLGELMSRRGYQPAMLLQERPL